MQTLEHPAGWATCFPQLGTTADGGEATLIDDGWDYRVVRVAGTTAVRIPRRTDYLRLAATEQSVLSELAPSLPVRIPVPRAVCATHGATCGPWLSGRPLDRTAIETVDVDRLADQLGATVAAIHRFPVDRALDLGVERRDLLEVIDRFERTVLPHVQHREHAQRLLHEARAALPHHTPCFVHGDLGPAHVLCDDRAVTAIIDWSDMAVTDPAIDGAWLLNGLDRALRRPLLDRWDIDAEMVRRADIIHRLGPWWEVYYGLQQDRADLVVSGLAGIDARLPR